MSSNKRNWRRPGRGVWAGIALTPVIVILVALLIGSIGGAGAKAGKVAASSAAAAAANSPVAHSLVPKGMSRAAYRAQVAKYWTPARMAAAKPYPEKYSAGSDAMVAIPVATTAGYPGGVNGVAPAATGAAAHPQPQTFPNALPAASKVSAQDVTPEHASYPPPRDTFEYGPRYRTYPASTVGKVFFSQDDDANGTVTNFVCSGSAVYVGDKGGTGVNRYVYTAGHCVNNGRNGAGANGGWDTTFTICPSYDSSQGGVNPNVGCWSAYTISTSAEWFSSMDFDRDWGGAAMNLGGNCGCNIGNSIGMLGRAWNWNDEHFWVFGYPQAAPYTGGKLIADTAEHAYTVNNGAGADSKYIGNEMTGGSSGGPWIKNFGYVDGNNWADGLNSNKRCTQAGCPPGSVLTEEMGSPPFTTEAGGSEDFFGFLATL